MLMSQFCLIIILLTFLLCMDLFQSCCYTDCDVFLALTIEWSLIRVKKFIKRDFLLHEDIESERFRVKIYPMNGQ